MIIMNLIKEINSFSKPLIINNFFSVFISTLLASIVGRISIGAIVSVEIVDTLNYALIGIVGVAVIVFNIEASKVRLKSKVEFYDWFKSCYIVNAMIGVFFMLLVFLGSRMIFRNVYNINGEALDIICMYAYIQSFYILSTLILFSMTNLIKVKQMTSEILKVGIVSSLVQVILSYVFVYYVFVYEYKIVGVALASILAKYLELLYLMYILRNDIKESLLVKSTKKLSLVIKSIPFILQELLEGGVFQIFVITMIARLGDQVMSSYSIGMKVVSFCLIPMYMYCNALTVLVGKKESQSDVASMRKLPLYTIMMTIVIYILISFIVIIFKKDVIKFLTNIDSVQLSSIKILFVLIFFSVFQIFFENTKYALQSIGESKYALFVTTLTNIIFIVAVSSFITLGKLNLMILLLALAINYSVIFIIFIRKYFMICDNILNNNEIKNMRV